MTAIEFGAKQAATNCLKVRSGEKAVVITDRHTESLADAIAKAISDAGGSVQKFVMEDFGARPEDGSSPLAFSKEIGKAIEVAQVGAYLAQSKKGEWLSFRAPLTELVTKCHIRYAHMPDFSEEMMGQGMAVDYKELKTLTWRVYDVVSKAKEIRVTTPGGTDIIAQFDQKYKWVCDDGDVVEGRWGNLPAGELYTVPIDANGRVVVDGCLGDYFDSKYGDMIETPLSYTLKGGRCVKGSVACSNTSLKLDFEEYTFGPNENSDRLGEFGIGTNVGVKKIIGNILQDEKIPGVHLALGDPYPEWTGAEWKSEAHNDGVLRKPTIVVDGKIVLMKDGRFLI